MEKHDAASAQTSWAGSNYVASSLAPGGTFNPPHSTHQRPGRRDRGRAGVGRYRLYHSTRISLDLLGSGVPW